MLGSHLHQPISEEVYQKKYRLQFHNTLTRKMWYWHKFALLNCILKSACLLGDRTIDHKSIVRCLQVHVLKEFQVLFFTLSTDTNLTDERTCPHLF